MGRVPVIQAARNIGLIISIAAAAKLKEKGDDLGLLFWGEFRQTLFHLVRNHA